MSGLAGSDRTDAGTVDVAGPQPGCSARAVASRGWMLRKDGNVMEEEIVLVLTPKKTTLPNWPH
jgi:hypothetical protein